VLLQRYLIPSLVAVLSLIIGGKMLKLLRVSSLSLGLLLISASSALAHVVVKPAEVGVGSFQTFTVGVPVEKEIPTVGLRLVIPGGLNHVSPNVKPGWKIETKKEANEAEEEAGHSEEKVTEITWSGGVIPHGQRDDFYFSAQVPAETTTLSWKAYQTYQDGSVVSWELGPNDEQPKDEEGNPDYSKSGPASETRVVDDLSQEAKTSSDSQDDLVLGANLTELAAYAALVIAFLALVLSLRKRETGK
jgi:uncharacterized protein YcnI